MTIERRKDPKPRLTITQILDQMQQVADNEYGGDLQNNVLPVFTKLAANDKKTLLRKSLLLIWEHQVEMAKASMQDIVIDQETRIDQVAVVKERKNIDAVNAEEQIKLKTWFHKVLFVLGVLLFIGVVAGTLVVGGSGVSVTDMLKDLQKIVELLL